MPVTTLDPKTALVLIDLQKGITGFPTVHPIGGVIGNAARLAAAFRGAGLPVVLVNVTFSPDGADRLRTRTDAPAPNMPITPEWSELVPELAAQATDLRITKRQWNAFYGTELELQLRRRGVTGIVLGGIATSIGVDSTARAAYERAFNVTLASDAMTDRDPMAHECSVTKIFPRLGEVGTTDAIVASIRR
ncbi:MAG TPA: hydrolase [Polyangiaceae bacterium]|nr:hydrolase [Polyangiaceae bacterium]